MFARIASLGLALTAALPAGADNGALRVTTGLPQVALVDGQALAWRYTTLRADASPFMLEAKLPGCIEPPRVVALADGAATSAVACRAPQSFAGPEVKGRLRLPRAFDAAPDVDVSILAWGAGDGGHAGSQADLELIKSIGGLEVFAGYSLPVGATAVGDAWRTRYAGLKWRVDLRHRFEFEIDHGREPGSRERDREATLRYAYSGRAGERLRVFATRLRDSSARWQSGVAADWSF